MLLTAALLGYMCWAEM